MENKRSQKEAIKKLKAKRQAGTTASTHPENRNTKTDSKSEVSKM